MKAVKQNKPTTKRIKKTINKKSPKGKVPLFLKILLNLPDLIESIRRMPYIAISKKVINLYLLLTLFNTIHHSS